MTVQFSDMKVFVLSILLFLGLLHSKYRYIELHENIGSATYIKFIEDLYGYIALGSPSGLKRYDHTRDFDPRDLHQPESGGQPKVTVQFSTGTET